ncbi:hypothetical protein BCV70DRAFT_239245 [Testicularia cyperi]|uniref:Uncharacterized protein n=1 Tax=Testicularia cyperi TaxID=1882483 RepID=A0A317XJV4_9BASI|nr:hypothetical protein BCV70DRAFT_239245 [Testicularia cyperi]
MGRKFNPAVEPTHTRLTLSLPSRFIVLNQLRRRKLFCIHGLTCQADGYTLMDLEIPSPVAQFNMRFNLFTAGLAQLFAVSVLAAPRPDTADAVAQTNAGRIIVDIFGSPGSHQLSCYTTVDDVKNGILQPYSQSPWSVQYLDPAAHNGRKFIEITWNGPQKKCFSTTDGEKPFTNTFGTCTVMSQMCVPY